MHMPGGRPAQEGDACGRSSLSARMPVRVMVACHLLRQAAASQAISAAAVESPGDIQSDEPFASAQLNGQTLILVMLTVHCHAPPCKCREGRAAETRHLMC